MERDNLAAYLNDHLAGSVAALELLGTLIGAAEDPTRKTWLESLRKEIQEDQDALRGVIAELRASESAIKQAAAWVAEKVGQATLAVESATQQADLAWLKGLEVLALGIQGKAALWRVMRALGRPHAAGTVLDFDALEARALAQFAKVDHARIAAALAAFAPAAGPRKD